MMVSARKKFVRAGNVWVFLGVEISFKHLKIKHPPCQIHAGDKSPPHYMKPCCTTKNLFLKGSLSMKNKE
jgi:hypothetical protein